MSEPSFAGTARTPPAARWLTRVLLVCLAASLALFAVVSIATLFFPYSVDYGEALPVDQARRILAGLPVYRPTLDEAPYVIDLYPPLYPALVAVAGAISGLPLLQLGRAVSIVAALAAGLLVGLFALRLTGSRLSGLVAAALFLANPFTVIWASMARIDVLALALSLSALWILYRRWNSWPWLATASALLAASIYTRQTYAVAASLAGTVWLWHNERRRALAFAGLLAGTCCLAFLALNTASNGGFYLNAVVANLGPYEPVRLRAVATPLAAAWPVALVVACVEIVHSLRRSPAKAEVQAETAPVGPFLRYGLTPYTAGALLAALTAGKIGSDVNYLLELVAALSIWAAGALVWLPRRRAKGRTTILILLCVQAAWVLVVDGLPVSSILVRWAEIDKDHDVYRQVQVAAREGPVLTDSCMDMVIKAGHGVYFEPFAYEQARREGLWQPDGLIREIEAHKFPLIVLDRSSEVLYAERWSEPITQAIEASYESTERVGGLVIFRPRENP